MAKVVLGKRPKSFTRAVKFTMVDGDEAELSLTFKYRTKREFGALIDGLIASASAPAKPAEDAAQQALDIAPDEPAAPAAAPSAAADDGQALKLSAFLETGIEAQADYILQIAESWDIGVPFDRENVMAFCDEQPAGAKAAMAMYREAITEGRLGN
jgi:hypothetical protein